MRTHTVFSFGSFFTCREYTDVDPDETGVCVYRDDTGECIGQIIGAELPEEDEDDEDNTRIIEFEMMINDWLEENFW